MNSSGVQLGLVFPPSGSTVKKPASTWAIVLASLNFNALASLSAVLVKHAHGMKTVCSSASLRLKGAGPLDANLLDGIESVNDGRLVLGVKHASKGFWVLPVLAAVPFPVCPALKTLLQVRSLSPC